MSSLTSIYGRIIAAVSRHSTDTIVSTLRNNVAALERSSAVLRARANRGYDQAAKIETQADRDTIEAARADRVRSKIAQLLD